jgi:hypothetical protein
MMTQDDKQELFLYCPHSPDLDLANSSHSTAHRANCSVFSEAVGQNLTNSCGGAKPL